MTLTGYAPHTDAMFAALYRIRASTPTENNKSIKCQRAHTHTPNLNCFDFAMLGALCAAYETKRGREMHTICQ